MGIPVNNPYDAAESRPKISPVIEWLLVLRSMTKK